ncbi:MULTISPECIES: phage protein Gp37 [unclassified Moraxella]|uniref:phage protein Gp37 n=1 Tax=unclassified Moraxella TaxID=2685852 RepID=UPI003AF6EFD2
MATPILTAIEQGIKDTIKAYYDTHGHNVRQIKSYGGDFDLQSPDEFAQVVSQFPAIWVTFKQAKAPSQTSNRKKSREYVFTVLVGAKSQRTEETARQGAFDKSGKLLTVGSYQLISDVEQALERSRLGLPIAPLEGGSISTLFNTRTNAETVSVLAYDWIVTATTSSVADEIDEPWLDVVTVDYILDEAHGYQAIASDINRLT